MNSPSNAAQLGKERIPLGTTKIIIFDTNAYRDFVPAGALENCRAKAIKLRAREHINSVFVLASPTVIWELTAHLFDPSDKSYNHCLKALIALGEHAVDPRNPTGGINLFPDSESTVCRELFREIPAENDSGIRNLGSFVKHIVKNAPDLSDPKAQAYIKHISSNIDATEKQWLDLMKDVLARCDPKAVKQFFGEAPDDDLRKKVSAYFGTQNFVDMWAGYMVAIHARKVGKVLSEEEIKKKSQIMMAVFPAPLHLMTSLLQKIAVDKNFKLDNPEKKRWNFIWDSQLAFSIGANHEIGGVPIFFVTSDGEIIKAAEAAGCGDRVLRLKDYLGSVGFE